MTYSKLKLARDGDVVVVTLNDPAALNALGVVMAEELRLALEEILLGDSPARAVVITGEGRAFCSGAHLQEQRTSRIEADGRIDGGAVLEVVYNPLVTAVRDMPIPIVTAVNGAAAGVGSSLALLGDIVVAGESAYFLQAFRRIGLVPDGGASYLLSRLAGKARAMEMMLLGERVPAAQALDWGLINRCVPDADVLPSALAIAQELARGPFALSLIRRQVWAGMDAKWGEQLQNERRNQRAAARSEDYREGVTAFAEKRPAVFKGR
jgi:2-(1,2-epoxy-1,2-dihydrophenyl)acetyl-CoA isomerase